MSKIECLFIGVLLGFVCLAVFLGRGIEVCLGIIGIAVTVVSGYFLWMIVKYGLVVPIRLAYALQGVSGVIQLLILDAISIVLPTIACLKLEVTDKNFLLVCVYILLAWFLLPRFLPVLKEMDRVTQGKDEEGKE